MVVDRWHLTVKDINRAIVSLVATVQVSFFVPKRLAYIHSRMFVFLSLSVCVRVWLAAYDAVDVNMNKKKRSASMVCRLVLMAWMLLLLHHHFHHHLLRVEPAQVSCTVDSIPVAPSAMV